MILRIGKAVFTIALLALATAASAQGRLQVVEEALEGALFASISVSASGYGHVVARTCDPCSDPGISLGINPESRFFIDDQEVPYTEFGTTRDGITTVFFDGGTRIVTRIKHHTRP